MDYAPATCAKQAVIIKGGGVIWHQFSTFYYKGKKTYTESITRHEKIQIPLQISISVK